jgi:hypothetical protein
VVDRRRALAPPRYVASQGTVLKRRAGVHVALVVEETSFLL